MLPEIRRILPKRFQDLLDKLPAAVQEELEELRFRIQQPVEIVCSSVEGFLTGDGRIAARPQDGVFVTAEDHAKILTMITNHSLYALDEELKRGYITLPGGHRVGMAGKAVLERGAIVRLKDIAGLNIRIAREKKGTAEPILPYLWDRGKVLNALLISPPRCGKTTLLRDLARLFSCGYPRLGIPGHRVGIIDERSEIAGCVNGIPQKDVGPRSDVLDGAPKAEGMMLFLRAMSPQLLITDEIGRQEDAQALTEVMNGGVSIIASAHGTDLDEIARRPALAKILQMGIFDRYVVLSRRKGAGTLEGIYDRHFRLVTGERLSC